MTKEVEYEEVPHDDLRDDQIFHTNSSKSPSSLEGGAVAVAGKGIYEGAKSVPSVSKFIPEKFKGKPTVEIGPITTPSSTVAKPPIPTTVGKFYEPNMVSEHGVGPGALKNALHNVDQTLANAAHEKWMSNPEMGFHLEGNRLVATPIGADLTPTLKPPTLLESMGPAPEPIKPLTSTQRAMQMAENIGSKVSPILTKLNPALVGLGYFGAGTEGMEALKRAQHGDYGRALIDLAGAGGTLASIHAPHPLAKLLGLGVGLGANYINQKLDENLGRNYAEGGLAHLAEGHRTGKPDESSAAFGHFPQMTPKRANPHGGIVEGFLDAFTGIPKNENMSVLDPQGLAYNKGYGYGEPIGMAANAIDPIKGLASVGLAKSAMPLIAGAGIIKNKGGNWLNPMSEELSHTLSKRFLDPKDTQGIQEMRDAGYHENIINRRINRGALNNWITSNLGNYIKNQMGTMEDPIRKLAEEGISHLPPDRNAYIGGLPYFREEAGFPKEGVAQSDLAKQWENAVDTNISVDPRKKYILNPKEKPWMDKLSMETPIHNLRGGSTYFLGFDHLKDVLAEALNSGAIRPDQLNKVSITDAVRRAHQYDQEMAKKAERAAAARMEDIDVHKEYPNGFKWVQLNQPGQFAEESNIMGHSVKGYEPSHNSSDWIEESGHAGRADYGLGGWNAIKSDKARVYSLRDSNGKSHVTIEGSVILPRWDSVPKEIRNDSIASEDWLNKNKPLNITQIKGKSNSAPSDEYLPFVHDFIKSGNHDIVSDFNNSGLIDLQRFISNPTYSHEMFNSHPELISNYNNPAEVKDILQKSYPNSKYITPEELKSSLNLQ